MKDEDGTLEYKKSIAQLREGVISLSAMLNKSFKGELYIGVSPDKTPHKFDISKKTLSDVSNEIRTNLKPLPTKIDIDRVTWDGVDVIRVYVKGSDTPYAAYGKYYSRLGEGDIPMTNSQLQLYFEQKKETYAKWENEPSAHSLDDIDEDLLIGVIREANDKGRLSYIYRNVREAMTKLDLIDEQGNIKMAGYYLFGKGKPLLIKEANYPTDERTDFGEIKQFRGNIFECIEEMNSYIRNHISFKADIVGLKREETPEIPLRAIREIVVNAFAHAKYASEVDSIQVAIFRSSLRINNPGTIYRDYDPMRFASSEIGSRIRNPLIASVLYKCGYIDAFGTGFDRTFTLCAKSGVTYEYHNSDSGFAFIFHRNPNFLADRINDRINDRIKSTDKAIISAISLNKFITIHELSKKIKKSEPTISRHLNKMSKNGRIRRIGSKKAGFWEIVD